MNPKFLVLKKTIFLILIYILVNLIPIYLLNTNPVFSLLISSFFSFLLIFYIWKWYYNENNAINNFGSFLLLSSLAYKIFNILVLLAVDDPFDSWPNGITGTFDLNLIMKTTSILIGEFLSVVGTLIISLTWFFLGGIKFSNIDYNFLTKKKNTNSIIWLLYLFASVIYFIGISELALFIYVSSYIIIYATIRVNKLNSININEHNLFRAILMLSPFISIALKTGMKEAVIIFLVPILIDFFYRFKTPFSRIFLIFGSFISFLVFTLIADFIRLNIWGTKQSLSISSILKYLSVTVQSINFEFAFALVSKALLRLSPLFYQGWTVSLSYINGIHYSGLFTNTLSMFVPRLLWPTKPLNNPEHEMTIIFYGDKIAETTNEASGLFSELYLKEGLFGFLILSFMLGVYIYMLQKIAFTIKNKLTFNVFNFILIYFSCRLHEFYFNAIFPGFILFLLIIFIFTTIVNQFLAILNTKPIIPYNK